MTPTRRPIERIAHLGTTSIFKIEDLYIVSYRDRTYTFDSQKGAEDYFRHVTSNAPICVLSPKKVWKPKTYIGRQERKDIEANKKCEDFFQVDRKVKA